jgi:hypothetical protein
MIFIYEQTALYYFITYNWKFSINGKLDFRIEYQRSVRPTAAVLKLPRNLPTVHRPGDDPRKVCEECGNARGSNVRYYPTWKHSPLKDYWLTNAHELLTTEW